MYQGKIHICGNCFDEAVRNYQPTRRLQNYDMRIMGTQFGEKFGHTLCALDLNNDGFDDLVVGAPLHAIDDVSTIYW